LEDKVEAKFSALAPLLSEVIDPVEELASAVADLDPADVTEFLVSRNKIAAGGSMSDVPADYAKLALKGLVKFREAINQFRQGRPVAVPATINS
jgi:hypothetical protein